MIDQVRAVMLPVIVTAIGTVTARATAAARPRVDGLLQSVSFREGQVVRTPATSSRKLIHCHFRLRYSRRRGK